MKLIIQKHIDEIDLLYFLIFIWKKFKGSLLKKMAVEKLPHDYENETQKKLKNKRLS